MSDYQIKKSQEEEQQSPDAGAQGKNSLDIPAEAPMCSARAWAMQALGGNAMVNALLSGVQQVVPAATGADFLGFLGTNLGDQNKPNPTPTPTSSPGVTPTPAPAPAPSSAPATAPSTSTPTPTPGPAKGPTPDEQVDNALKDVKKNFETGLFDWAVTDKEAKAALDTLNKLPPDLQGKAIEKMDKGTFDTLLSNVPEMDRVGFESLMKNTHDPEKKLKLWGEYHKSKAMNDAATEKEKTKDEGSWWPWSRTSEQDENRRLNGRRDEIVSSTKDEVDDEVSVAMDLLKKGKLTEADVDAIARRKNKELGVEMKHNVNLTSDEGVREQSIAGFSKGSKIAWSESELDSVETALGRMPASHVKGNDMLKEIRRAEMSSDEEDPKNPNIGGQHGSGVIRIYDLGVNANYRHNGEPVELQDPSKSHPLTPLEETLTHEIGHDIHDQNKKAFEEFRKSAGWKEDQSAGDLEDAGLTEAEIKSLKEGKVSQVTKDGKVYSVDPYNKGIFGGKRFVSHDQDAIPGAPATGRDTWSYARTNSKDHFAETYMKAINKPETLAKDLLDAPEARVKKANDSVTAADKEIKRLESMKPVPEDKLKAAKEAKKTAEAAAADAVADQTARNTQWKTMRDDVFHTDTATSDAVKRLTAKGLTPKKIEEFKKKAGRAMTPEQVARIEAGY